jgi:hypothetical protein
MSGQTKQSSAKGRRKGAFRIRCIWGKQGWYVLQGAGHSCLHGCRRKSELNAP